VDYVAQAPKDKSVEDLSRQEVDTALRNKIPVGAIEEDTSALFFENEQTADEENDSNTMPTSPAEKSPSHSRDHPGETVSIDAADNTTNLVEGETLEDHVEAVAGSNGARFLTEDLETIEELEMPEVFDALVEAERVPWGVIIDGPVTQRLLDVTAQRGVAVIIGTSLGEVVKQPVAVRVRTFDEIGVPSLAE
jgi:DNA primase